MCCTSLKNVIIPESVGYIGSCSFDNDDGIERIIVCPYMVKGLVQLDSGAYYASVVIDGEQKDVMGIKSICPTELFYEMKSGVKKRISLLCEYEEWVLDDDGYDYTGEVTTGKIDEKSLETGIVSFVSDNPDIVSVSETGVIATGLPGKATITIQMVPEKRLCAKLVVKVTER